MDDWKLPWDGGCRCGSVRLRVSAPPIMASACHCSGCQVLTGSAFSLSLTVPASGFAFTAGTPVTGALRGPDRYMYCPDCKSWLTTHPRDMEAFVNLRPSTLDDHRWFAPFIEEATAEKLPWATTPAAHSFATSPGWEDFDRLLADYAERGARPA